MLVAELLVFLIFLWVIQRGRNLPAAGAAAPQQHQVLMQPIQETYIMQALNSEMVLFLPKGSRRDPRRTYQSCLVTRKCATMAHSASEYDDDIFASAVSENYSGLMYTKSLFVHGRLPETVFQHSPAECYHIQDALQGHRESSCSVIFSSTFPLSEQVHRN